MKMRQMSNVDLTPCLMPAEWEPHRATWLAWPHNQETWPGKIREVEEIYLQMIEALADGERVHLLVNDEKIKEYAARRLSGAGISDRSVVYFLVPTVDAWVRDYGLIFVKRLRQGVTPLKWRFNAWGGKYADLAEDNGVFDSLEPLLKAPFLRPDLVLEGGSIDTNGEGTCLLTEQCLLNPNRNPHLSRDKIEKILHDFLGFTHFIWLARGIEGDDTDGHIDDITRFVNPTTVVTAVEENESDPNHEPLRENLRRLKEATDQDGRALEVVPLPMPDRVEGPEGRLPASYLNFYIANEVVLVPVFGQKKDRRALEILKEWFPKRTVLGIRSESLVMGLGGIHCVTHEEPQGET